MARGRPRKAPPNLPPHVAPHYAKVPAGIYWDRSGSGRWYVLEVADDGKRKAKTVAGPGAYLSDLHAIAEQRKGISVGTVSAVLEHFHKSSEFRALAPRTQKDYARYRIIIDVYPTKLNAPFGQLTVARMTQPVVQRLIEAIAQNGHPTKANHLLRYLHRVFRWGVNHGHCPHNPAAGVRQVKEASKVTIPDLDSYRRVLEFAMDRAARTARTPGSCAPYLPLAMELAYLCRLRGIEVITLTDANVTAQGIITNRRKGSRDTLVQWSPRLRAIVDAALALRKATYTRTRYIVPIHPDRRPLIVAESGDPLTKSGFDSAWQRLMRLASDPQNGIITASQRFGLHAMKHRGITDTTGTTKDKQLAGGHRSEAMTHRYDHSLPAVSTPGEPVFQENFQEQAKPRR